MSLIAKAALTGVIALCGITIVAALITGTIAVAIAGFQMVMHFGVMNVLIGYIGTKAAVTTVLAAIGVGTTFMVALINKFA